MAGARKSLRVGLVGAGIGGLAAAIAIARAGADVTVLEAAEELGEIGAGIQMTPNVARLLRAWEVDKVIGSDLVQFEELNMRTQDGTPIGYTPISRVEGTLGQPWWLVHRHHLHQGLVAVARKHGCKLYINSRVSTLEYSDPSQPVHVSTVTGSNYTFDLVLGSDGVGSIVRRILFPNVVPRPPTNNSAYRAIVPYSQLRADPLTAPLAQKLTMEVWMAPGAYIISYPISGGKDFNMVLSHHTPSPTSTVTDVSKEEMRDQYKDFDPRIRRVVDMIPSVQRWPLLVTGPLPTWSSPAKNVVLMGDAAHSMTNHMAQGAATAMEDGAFLGVLLRYVIKGNIGLDLPTAIELYEKHRMPRAHSKQQVSFLNGAIWMCGGEAGRKRDEAMKVELEGKPFLRSPNLYGDPRCVLEVYGYDAEADAEEAVRTWCNGSEEEKDEKTVVTRPVADWVANWYYPEGEKIVAVKSKI